MKAARFLPAIGASLFICAQLHAAPADWNVVKHPRLSAEIDALHAYYDAPHSPGAIIAVLRHGEVIHLRGYGFANREFEAPWTPDTLYTFFSTTKSMTCLALLTLAEQGKLSLEDEIQTHLTDFPRFDQPIKIWHLMNHTSGLWQDESVMHLAGIGAAYAPVTLDELYELNRKQPRLPYAPGSNWYYNDAGMRLAARIIERVTGEDFDTAMRELVFAPAGMKTARTKSYEPEFWPDQAASYFLDGQPKPDPSVDALRLGGIIVETSGDGAGVGTIRDYIAYARYLIAPRADGPRWIDALTVTRPTAPWYTYAYKYGLIEQTHRGLRLFQHGGLYGKRIAYVPELDVWVLMMRNALDYEVAGNLDRVGDIIDAVLRNVAGGFYLSERNPEREAVLGVPRDQQWTAAEAALLSGTYVEPDSGFVVRLRASQGKGVRQVEYTFHGEDGVLVRAPGTSGFITYAAGAPNAIRLAAAGDGLQLQYADWPAPRPMERIGAERRFTPEDMAELAGWYRHDPLNVFYEITRAGEGLELRIGSANRNAERFPLRSITPDVVEAYPGSEATFLNLRLTIKIERREGRPVRLVITSEDVKDLRFSKVDWVSAH